MTKIEKIVCALIISGVALFVGSIFAVHYFIDRNHLTELYILCPPGEHCECIDNSCTLLEVIK